MVLLWENSTVRNEYQNVNIASECPRLELLGQWLCHLLAEMIMMVILIHFGMFINDGNLDTFWNVHHISDFILRFHMCVCVLSHIQLFVTPWTVTHQASLSMGFPVSITNKTAINIHL